MYHCPGCCLTTLASYRPRPFSYLLSMRLFLSNRAVEQIHQVGPPFLGLHTLNFFGDGLQQQKHLEQHFQNLQKHLQNLMTHDCDCGKFANGQFASITFRVECKVLGIPHFTNNYMWQVNGPDSGSRWQLALVGYKSSYFKILLVSYRPSTTQSYPLLEYCRHAI